MKAYKPICVALMFFCQTFSGCLTYYPGTQYERKVPLAGYVGGVAGATLGGTLALVGWKGDDLGRDGSSAAKGLDGSPDMMAWGEVLAGAGVISLLGSVVYELLANRESDSLPVSKYPMIQEGKYGYHRATGKRLFVKKVTSDYDEQGSPYNHYYACEHTGISADCWWLREWDLAYKRVFQRDPSKDIPEPPEGLHGLPYLEEIEESPPTRLDSSGLPLFIDLKKIRRKNPRPRFQTGQELFLKTSGQLVKVKAIGYRLDENGSPQPCYEVCGHNHLERGCRVVVESGLED